MHKSTLHPKMPIGVSDYKKLREGQYLHVDKSLFIKELLDDGSDVILFPRPRRFGKTLNLSMLKYFFDVTEDNAHLFKNTKLAKEDKSYMAAQGKAPVIMISLKEIKAATFERAYQQIAGKLAKLYKASSYLLESPLLKESDKTIFNSIIEEKAQPNHIEDALCFLSALLYQHHNAKAYILIDEYDAPIISSVEYDYTKEMLLFMRNFLGSALKDNVNLEKGVLTGIMRISKESIFSGINNLRVYGYLSNRYGEYFGFEEHEVKQLLSAAESDGQQSQDVKEWYNGYIIGEKIVYNPWSIINFIDENFELKPYWVNTSDNYLIKQAFAKASLSVKREFEELIQGKPVIRDIQESLTIEDLKQYGEQALWGLLCLSGYLKINSYKRDLGKTYCELAIPNKEILSLYSVFIERWFSDTLDVDQYYEFLKSLTTGDLKTFHHYLTRFLEESTSHFDLQQKEPERVYHSLVLGMIVGLRGQYFVKSNRESGLGRYDVMLIPNDKSKLGIIIEFKTAKKCSDENDLQNEALAALQQIRDKNYRCELEQMGIRNILEIGLAFIGKRVVYKI